MNEPIQRQEMILKVYCYEGKKHLEGWALSAMGIAIPEEEKNNHFEYTQEEIDNLIEQYMQASPSICVRIEEDYSHDVQQNKYNLK